MTMLILGAGQMLEEEEHPSALCRANVCANSFPCHFYSSARA